MRVDSEGNKPLGAHSSQLTLGGGSSSSKDEPILHSNRNASAPRKPIKRPFDSNNQTTSADLKKAKCSDGTSSASASAKGEPKSKGNADEKKPLARRQTISEPLERDPPAKKIAKSSQFSKTTDQVSQGSGGRKKWSTLVHNGILFPPPYKPHGVKMLYDGQPVDLTPEQEEVIYITYIERPFVVYCFLLGNSVS